MIIFNSPPEAPGMDHLLQQLLNPVNLFEKLGSFEAATQRARRLGYRVYEFDCQAYRSEDDILKAVAQAFGGQSAPSVSGTTDPEQYWRSFQAPPPPQYGAENAALIAFRDFDSFYRRAPNCAQGLLNVLAMRHYWDLKAGYRLLVCIHVREPAFRLELGPALSLEVKV
ncbi:hypothetical protein EON80_17370, partial [bacterium]